MPITKTSGRKAPKHCYWRGDTLWLRLKIGGTEHRETLRTSAPREADRHAREIRERLCREEVLGKPVEPATSPPWHTWTEAVTKWEAEVLPGAVKPGVAKRYKVSIGQLAATFGGSTMETISAQTVAAYVSSRAGKATNATIRRDLTALSRLLAACIAWGWRQDNPARAYDRSLVRERRDVVHPPTPEEVAKLLAFAPPGVSAVLRLLHETGVRENEAVTLERFQVDSARRQIVLTRTKTSRPRTIAWTTPPGGATRALSLGGQDGFLFRSERGGPYANFAVSARDAMRRLVEHEAAEGRVFRRFRVHDLRHAFAVRWLKAGGSIYALSRHLGHSSITTTEKHYLGFLTYEEQEAVRRMGAIGQSLKPMADEAAQAA